VCSVCDAGLCRTRYAGASRANAGLVAAWRSGHAIAGGNALNNDDRLITGANARVLLQSADGSQIKLG